MPYPPSPFSAAEAAEKGGSYVMEGALRSISRSRPHP